MRTLAKLCEDKGHRVTGSDISLNGHDKKNIENCDIVVYTNAVGEDNVEVIEARVQGITVYERAEFLGLITKDYQNVISVSGTHGKTTASAMIAKVFKSKNPTLHIGGTIEDKIIGQKEYFICEACEYKRSFLHLNSSVAVVLNMQLDHTDYYKDFNDYKSAFKDFVDKSQIAVIFGDDKNTLKLKREHDITFGLKRGNDIRAKKLKFDDNGWGFDVYYKTEFVGHIKLKVFGKHNVYNALSAIAVAKLKNIKFEEIKKGLEEFCSVSRRFEFLGEFNGAQVYSDYAHHPTELLTTIASAREAGHKGVIVVFEPHTFTRTQSLSTQFADSLKLADEIILMPIYPAREAPIAGVSSNLITEKLKEIGKNAYDVHSYNELFELLKKRELDDSLVVFAGAGTIDNNVRRIVKIHNKD